MRCPLCGLLFLVCALSATADEHQPEESVLITPLLSVGLTAGGDTIATYRVEYLGDEFDADVDAGEVFFLYGGVSMTWPRAHLGLQLQGGLFGGGVGGWDDSADFTRWPVELIAFFESSKLRVGVGVTRHFSPKFEEEGTAGDLELDFDDASGWLAQLEYISGNASIGLRHVMIDYEIGDAELDGDHWGLYGTFRVGQ